MTVAGVMREYLVAVPMAYDPNRPYPLVIGLHGSGGDRQQLRGYMDVETPAAGGAIFIYPSGLPASGGSTGWSLGNGSDDLAFIDALIAQYSAELCIDRRRVFATGHSFGGCMSNTLGCFRGELLRAIAPVAGCGPSGRNTACTGRIATLQIHSPKDTQTNYSGGITACTRYLRANGCDEMPTCGCHFVDGAEPGAMCVQLAQEPYQTSVSMAATDRDEQPPTARSYLACDALYPVVFVDHWRRERAAIGDPGERWHNPPPWSGALIWEFFSRLPTAEVE
jgi:predicted esterase